MMIENTWSNRGAIHFVIYGPEEGVNLKVNKYSWNKDGIVFFVLDFPEAYRRGYIMHLSEDGLLLCQSQKINILDCCHALVRFGSTYNQGDRKFNVTKVLWSRVLYQRGQLEPGSNPGTTMYRTITDAKDRALAGESSQAQIEFWKSDKGQTLCTQIDRVRDPIIGKMSNCGRCDALTRWGMTECSGSSSREPCFQPFIWTNNTSSAVEQVAGMASGARTPALEFRTTAPRPFERMGTDQVGAADEPSSKRAQKSRPGRQSGAHSNPAADARNANADRQ